MTKSPKPKPPTPRLIRQARACGLAAGLADRIALATEQLNDANERITKLLESDDYREFPSAAEQKQLAAIHSATSKGIGAIEGASVKAFALKEAMISRK